MSEEIIKIFDNIASRFGIVVDWTSENIIPYIQELFNRYVLCESITTIIWLLIGISCLIASIKLFKKAKKPECIKNDTDIFFIVIGIILVTTGSAITIMGSMDLIKCLIFPEMLIIQMLQG